MTIGERLRALREGAELSQGALGEKLHMTQRKVSYIETGMCEPSIEDIKEICTFFGISANYLLGLPDSLKHPKR